MNNKTRRFAATLAITFVLAGAPAAFAVPRTDDRGTTPIVKFIKRVWNVISFNIQPVGPWPTSNVPTP